MLQVSQTLGSGVASDLGAGLGTGQSAGSAVGAKKPKKKNATQLAVDAINKAFAEAGEEDFAPVVSGSINMLQH